MDFIKQNSATMRNKLNGIKAIQEAEVSLEFWNSNTSKTFCAHLDF